MSPLDYLANAIVPTVGQTVMLTRIDLGTIRTSPSITDQIKCEVIAVLPDAFLTDRLPIRVKCTETGVTFTALLDTPLYEKC